MANPMQIQTNPELQIITLTYPQQVPKESLPYVPNYVIGYRVWDIVVDVGSIERNIYLASFTGHTRWPYRQALEAKCFRPQDLTPHHHTNSCPPDIACACGIYAYADAMRLVEEMQRMYSSLIYTIGAIAMWGRVIRHQHGYRSQYAYPLSLNIPSRKLLFYNGAPPEVITAFDQHFPGYPTCDILHQQYGVPVASVLFDQWLRQHHQRMTPGEFSHYGI